MDEAELMVLLRRLDAVERNHTDLSSSHTKLVSMIEGFGTSFSDHQVAQIRAAFREEIADAGLRLDDGDHQDEARRDFMFLRSLRKGVNGTAAKIGWLVIAAVCGAVIWLVNSGLSVWRGLS